MSPAITDHEIIKLFLSNVTSTDDGCWIWDGLVNNKNRAYFYCEGTTQVAARVSYRIYKGDIPERKMVMHSCDNPCCVNPEHLSLGTAWDNHKDMADKGRRAVTSVKGSRHGCARLNESDVKEIRRLLASGELQINIANKFGVTYQTISHIKTKRTWTHV